MKNKRTIRTYHLTDAKLALKAKEKIRFMQRDALHFVDYGITENHITALALKLETFLNQETDKETKGQQTEITLAKKAKAIALRGAIENVMTIVARKYKKGRAHYKAFGSHNLSLQKEADLYLTAKLVVKQGSLNMTELAENGLTDTILGEIATLNDDYCDVLVSQKIAQAGRIESTDSRIAMGNEIYTDLIRFSNVGLAIWKNKSSAKYNDYLMYPVKISKKSD